MDSSYSLADIAAATGGTNRNNDGFGDGGAWWIIILFLFVFCAGAMETALETMEQEVQDCRD